MVESTGEQHTETTTDAPPHQNPNSRSVAISINALERMTGESKYLRILFLDNTATSADVRKAYRNLTRILHPDKVGKDVACEKAFLLVGAAKEYLEKTENFEKAVNAFVSDGGGTANVMVSTEMMKRFFTSPKKPKRMDGLNKSFSEYVNTTESRWNSPPACFDSRMYAEAASRRYSRTARKPNTVPSWTNTPNRQQQHPQKPQQQSSQPKTHSRVHQQPQRQPEPKQQHQPPRAKRQKTGVIEVDPPQRSVHPIETFFVNVPKNAGNKTSPFFATGGGSGGNKMPPPEKQQVFTKKATPNGILAFIHMNQSQASLHERMQKQQGVKT